MSTDAETLETLAKEHIQKQYGVPVEHQNGVFPCFEMLASFKAGWRAREQNPSAEVLELVESIKELRIYCLGSDASTRNMIEKFDKALAAFEKSRGG